MQLTRFSDYALRVLMFAQAAGERLRHHRRDGSRVWYLRAHLATVVNALTRADFLVAVRGRYGGLRLAREPSEINIGDVVRATEPDFALVECFASGTQCVVTQRCRLQGILRGALKAFLAELDRHTLESITLRQRDFPKTLKPANRLPTAIGRTPHSSAFRVPLKKE
jgi:Rrf2 family nitric oxide-sensitive transcriptional repressor